jgi:hypothetical protein
MIIGLAHDIYCQFKNLMGIHLLLCSHERECIASHDTIWDAFTFIARNVSYFMLEDICFSITFPPIFTLMG